MNSREKGKRGERAWRDELRAQGYEATRGAQHSGSPDSPDVRCDALPFHFEVKCVERLNIQDAIDQAVRDCGSSKVPVVAHKRNHCDWLVTMRSADWFALVREMVTENAKDHSPIVAESASNPESNPSQTALTIEAD